MKNVIAIACLNERTHIKVYVDYTQVNETVRQLLIEGSTLNNLKRTILYPNGSIISISTVPDRVEDCMGRLQDYVYFDCNKIDPKIKAAIILRTRVKEIL